ncbi:MAG TPA: cell division protein ZapE, partial [Leucothrix sp.]|nr:cell division protein ZapE [Leucothrix sp.]
MSNNVQLLEKIQKGPIEPDLKQSEALFILQEISDKLVEAAKASSLASSLATSLATSLALSSHNSNEHLKKESKTKFSFLSFFKAETPQQESQVDTHDIKAIKGLYLWGDVGRGKTWLMDQFFTSVAIQNKRRIHFHAFMLQVHKKLQDLPSQP